MNDVKHTMCHVIITFVYRMRRSYKTQNYRTVQNTELYKNVSEQPEMIKLNSATCSGSG